jgi:hypothetical protein
MSAKMDIWAYAPESGFPFGESVVGFEVEAADGVMGHVDRQSDRQGMQHLVVDTGVWVFGRSVLVPAGMVSHVDVEARRVTLTRTREEVKSAPPFARDSETADLGYLSRVDEYYAGLGPALVA